MQYHSNSINTLNTRYKTLSPIARLEQLYQEYHPSEILVTSSFGASSVYLLHLIQRVNPGQEIYFIDTTYHFKETIEYKNELVRLFQLNVTDLKPDQRDNAFTRKHQLWNMTPNLCCDINKVDPLEKIKPSYKIWVSGLMSHQSHRRENLELFATQSGLMKFYPIFDVREKEVREYMQQYHLPEHPLKEKGYHSIGCAHCTISGNGRDGRWAGSAKTECGLHLRRN